MLNSSYLLTKHTQLNGDRILLRPVNLEDAEDMHEYASDKENTRFVFEKHQDLKETKHTIAELFIKEPLGKFAIVLKESSKMIGTIALNVSPENRSAEMGYALNKRYWGKGYMTESGKLLLKLGFAVLELERIYARHDAKNCASGRVMQRIGMTYEGVLRRNRLIRGKFVDDVLYSILKEEYSNGAE